MRLRGGLLAAALFGGAIGLGLHPGSVAASEPIIDYYQPDQAEADILPLISQITEGLASPEANARLAAHKVLRDLARSAASTMQFPHESPAQTERWLRGLPVQLPPEYTAWSTMVRQLLYEHVGPHMEALLADSTLVWRSLYPAGIMGWDTPTYREFALRHLSNPDRDRQSQAANYFSRLGTSGVEIALDLLPGENPRQREGLFKVLASGAWDREGLPPERVGALTDTLVAALKDCSPEIRSSAARALRRPGFALARIAPALLNCIRTGEPSLAQSCMIALAGPESLDPSLKADLEEFLGHADEEVSRDALHLLLQWDDTDTLVVAALDSPHPMTRSAAIAALETLDLPADSLVALLGRGLLDPRTQDAASHACTRLGRQVEGVLPALEQAAAQSTNTISREYTLRAMASVARDSIRIAATYRRFWREASGNERESILRMLAPLGEAATEFLPEITARLRSDDPGDYRLGLNLVAVLGDHAKPLVPMLSKGLHSELPWLRDPTLRTLAAIGSYPCAERVYLEAVLADAGSALETRILVGKILDSPECR